MYLSLHNLLPTRNFTEKRKKYRDAILKIGYFNFEGKKIKIEPHRHHWGLGFRFVCECGRKTRSLVFFKCNKCAKESDLRRSYAGRALLAFIRAERKPTPENIEKAENAVEALEAYYAKQMAKMPKNSKKSST